MNNNTQSINQQCSRAVTIIKLLWEKFKVQPLSHQVITLFVIAFTSLCLVVFYSTFLIWQTFYYVMTKGLMISLEWYLKKETEYK